MQVALPVLQTLAPPGAEHLAEVVFKGTRRAFYTTDDLEIREGEYVVVEAERGHDLGRVRSLGGVAQSKCSASNTAPTQRLVRVATPDEVRQAMVLRADEERVRRQTRELVEKHGLKMKISDAEWQWDRNKLTIFFTAERRVDFRELVRDLARTFRTRIELKQIGVRDEAALLGGVGRCGRQLCCATWLREIRPVSLQLAKDQNLSLNPSQISGTCGRLMCCLTYEHDSYLQARKRFPREGKTIQTARGAEKVIGIDIWRDSVTLLDETRQRRVVTLAELKAEIASLHTGKTERPRPAGRSEPEADPAVADRAAPAKRAASTAAGPTVESARRPPGEPDREPAGAGASAPEAPASPAAQPARKRRNRPAGKRAATARATSRSDAELAGGQNEAGGGEPADGSTPPAGTPAAPRPGRGSRRRHGRRKGGGTGE